jgi:hypothetical protein
MKQFIFVAVVLLGWFSQQQAGGAPTLEDLKKLEIICFVPSYLPKDFRLKNVQIYYDDIGPDEGVGRRLPLYGIEWGNGSSGTGGGSTFSIDSAREGIGDRNIMEEEDTEETELQTFFGPTYLIYRPKGKGKKIEIRSNWMSDANMIAEKAKDESGHPILGRYHGFTGTGMTVAEFDKIVQSLHPINPNAPTTKPSALSLRIHPKVFNMIDCWISDSEGPVVTEINLNAVELDRNEFNHDDVKPDGEWLRCPVPNTNGFMRYRVREWKGTHYKVEYQENAGGTLTTDSTIEFLIENRTIQRDGNPLLLRVLRVLSYKSK